MAMQTPMTSSNPAENHVTPQESKLFLSVSPIPSPENASLPVPSEQNLMQEVHGLRTQVTCMQSEMTELRAQNSAILGLLQGSALSPNHAVSTGSLLKEVSGAHLASQSVCPMEVSGAHLASQSVCPMEV